MIMREYLVTVHPDGHISAVEYEEASGFVYSDRYAAVERDAYNQALRDVMLILESESARCESNSRLKRSDTGWILSWAARSVECELIRKAIEKLFRKS